MVEGEIKLNEITHEKYLEIVGYVESDRKNYDGVSRRNKIKIVFIEFIRHTDDFQTTPKYMNVRV